MNKKRLSVVMAGAMLASSVAPVLAAEVEKSEYSAAQLGLLKKELRELLESKTFHSTDKKAGESVYYVTNGLTGAEVNTVADLDSFISGLTAGSKVYVWSEGFRVDEKGNYFSTTKTEESVYGKYSIRYLVNTDGTTTGTELSNQIETYCWQKQSNGKYNEAAKFLVGSYSYIEADKSAVIKMNNNREIVLTEGSEILDFSKPIDADGYEVKFSEGDLTTTNSAKSYDDLSDELKNKVDSIVGFASKTVKGEEGKDIVSEKLKEITITTGGNDLTVEDLYDGLMLTTEGHDLLNEIKYYDKVSAGSVNVAEPTKIKGTDKYGFTITFNKVSALSPKTINVTGTDSKNINRLQDWLAAKEAKVDILAGDNRYETAVAIAKEQALAEKNLGDKNYQGNIVLVNGNSLVDGLSAAPLAAALRIHNTDTPATAAPILLTEADALPKATKSYLKELLAQKPIGELKTTIHLVGGTSVLNKSLERELKGLGFDVVRYGGDNREETSLKVAEAIEAKSGKLTDVFVVGAEGEADAMSIAAVASKDLNNSEVGVQSTPIIVSKKGGLTEDATDAVKKLNVTVVGGENAVSKADYEAIKSEANSVNRIAGANRKATNALVIEKYYTDTFGNTQTGASATAGTAQNVIVAKDGQRNKMELVDALAAANMASNKKAPIVLATDKLSDAQINALELNAQNAATLYQVGHGVARDVVKTIAQRLGLAN